MFSILYRLDQKLIYIYIMKLLTNSGHTKGVTMNKPIYGHIDSGGGTGCIEGYGGIYPDGNGAPLTKPGGDGCKWPYI